MSKAVCRKDKHSDYWTSYNLEKIEYAKSGCEQCPVKKECFMSAYSSGDQPVGVIAGLSEFERRVLTWKEDQDKNGSNW